MALTWKPLILTGAGIADNAIDHNKIAPGAVSNHHIIAGLDAGKITVGKLDAIIIDTETLKSHEIWSETGFIAELASNTVTANTVQGRFLNGKVISGAVIQTKACTNNPEDCEKPNHVHTAQGLRLTSSQFMAYNSAGNPTFTISAATGNVWMGAGAKLVAPEFEALEITSGTIRGTTIIGGSFKTHETVGPANVGMLINEEGFVAYAGSGGHSLALDFKNKKFVFNGDLAANLSITSPNITGGTIAGAALYLASVETGHATAPNRLVLNAAGIAQYKNNSDIVKINSNGVVIREGIIGADTDGGTGQDNKVTFRTRSSVAGSPRGIWISDNKIAVYNNSGKAVVEILGTSTHSSAPSDQGYLTCANIVGSVIRGGEVIGASVKTSPTAGSPGSNNYGVIMSQGASANGTGLFVYHPNGANANSTQKASIHSLRADGTAQIGGANGMTVTMSGTTPVVTFGTDCVFKGKLDGASGSFSGTVSAQTVLAKNIQAGSADFGYLSGGWFQNGTVHGNKLENGTVGDLQIAGTITGKRIQTSSGDYRCWMDINTHAIRAQQSNSLYADLRADAISRSPGVVAQDGTKNAYMTANGYFGTNGQALILSAPGSYRVVTQGSGVLFETIESSTASVGLYRNGSTGALHVSSSIRSAKLDLDYDNDDWAEGVLKLKPVTWYDKAAYVNALEAIEEAERNNKEVDDSSFEHALLTRRIPGFIAEEVEEVLPAFAIYQDDDTLQTVAYERLPAALVVLAQRQEKQIKELTARLDSIMDYLETLQ